MKKLIALILILVITSFVVVSKDSKPLNFNIAKEKTESPNSKNKNWEYVKDRLFDGQTEKVYKIEGPILVVLNKASKQDSLAVHKIMKELRTILPHKTIDYFNNFTGMSFEKSQFGDYNKKFKGISLHKLRANTIKLHFVDKTPGFPTNLDYVIQRSGFSKSELSIYNENRLTFNFNKLISYERRKRYIQYEILRTLCYVNPAKQYPIHYNRNGVFETPDYVPDQARFNELDKFLLQKLYSDDFIGQFKDYMYANYPWRYASSFVNRKMHEFKVWGIIIALGILSFVLIFSYFKDVKYRYSYLNYLFSIFSILLFFLNLNLVYDYLTKFNSVITWRNNILFILIFPLVVAPLISFVLWGLEKISFKGNENFSYQLILKVIFTFLSFLVLIVFVLVLESDRKGLFEFFFPYIFFSAGLSIGRGLLLYLNHFSESLVKEKDIELSRLKEAKAEAEVKMLQSQINPHFLYNALNSIASLAHTDADKTEKMALSLSDLFRHTINRKVKKVNTLEDEINLVRNYLEIEQIRFGDRLKFSIDVDPDLLEVEIPMFILQPLVENAIKHGISKIEGQGEIALQIVKKNNGILISVQDNGPDFPEGLVSGHGLQTVYDLLRFSYGDKAEISWHNQPKKEITIYIDTVSK
jgi:two-component system LytT family sensor kinase